MEQYPQDIILINPALFLPQESYYSKARPLLPPLGLLSIAAEVRKKYPFFNIRVLDLHASGCREETLKEELKDFSPLCVGITAYSVRFSAVLKIASTVKEIFPHCMVVVGGSHASIAPEECLRSDHIDVVVVGEGERTFLDLLGACIDHKDLRGIPNIGFKENGRCVRTLVDAHPLDLDLLAFPLRSLVDMRIYRPAHGTYTRLPATNMVTSRGCPFDCSFCSKNVFGSYYRTQSPRRTVNEIKELIAQYRIREVAFSDDIFTVDRRRIVALCDLLLQDNVNICWSCNTRVDTVDRLLLRIMQRAGCVSIGYGIETASSQLLRQVAKGSVRAQAQEAIKCTKDAGIETRAFYMLAFPGETEKSIRDTIQLSIELDTDFTAYNFVVPFPGTQLYEYCKARHLLRYEGLELYDFLDGFHPLIKLDGIDPHQLVQLYNSAYRSYYFRATYLLNRFKKVRSLQDVRRYWEGLRSFMN